MFGKNNSTVKEDNMNEGFAANIIQNGTFLSGDIQSSGNIRIDGKLEGKLTTKEKLVVGKTGELLGEVRCKNASIEGLIEGKVVVEDLLFLKSTAIILGDIITKKIVVEEGAKFNGTCVMGGNAQVDNALNKNGKSKKSEETEESVFKRQQAI